MQSNRCQGVALITVILVMALGTIIVVGAMRSSTSLIDQSSYISQAAAARQLFAAAEARALETLREEYLDQDNAVLPEPLLLENEWATLKVEFIDLQSRLNINSLLTCEQCFQVLERLAGMQALGLRADPLLDWMDDDDIERVYGAESWKYETSPSSYRAANRIFMHASEVNLVENYSAEFWQQIAPYVVALPTDTGININSASSELLEAISPQLRGEQITLRRDTVGPYTQLTEFLFARETAGGQLNSDILSVSTTYIALQSSIEIEGEAFHQTRILNLAADGDVPKSLGIAEL